jgi:DNA-binding transcriptional LysR family regulator
MWPDLRRLRYLAAVADAGQISRAAQTLYMTQPALSQSLAQLERDVGVPLLRRHARGVELTEAGEALLTKGRLVLQNAAEGLDAARSGTNRPSSKLLTIGFLPHTLGPVARATLDLFAVGRPDVTIRLRELTYVTHTSSLADGKVDAAFLWPPYDDSRISLLTLASEPRMLGVSRRHHLADAHQVALEDVLDETFAGYHPASTGGWFRSWYFEPERGERPRLSADAAATPHQMGSAVLAGRAVAPAAATFARAFELPGIRWVSLSDAPNATLALAWRRGTRSAAIQSLRRVAAHVAGGLAATSGPPPLQAVSPALT